MNKNKRTRLTLMDRQVLCNLAALSNMSLEGSAAGGTLPRQQANDLLKRVRLQEFTPRNSTNQRFKTL